MARTQYKLSIDALLFWLFVTLLLWVPIPLGSNRPWSLAVLEVAVFGLTAATLLAWAWGKIEIPPAFRAARGFLGVLALWLVYLGVYLIPLPPTLLEALSPNAAHLHSFNAPFSVGSWGTLSVAQTASWQFGLLSAAYVITFALSLLLINSRERVKQFAYAMVFAALAQSIYGVLTHLSEASPILFGNQFFYGGEASGTYPNRNHFAGYLEMTLAIGIGLLIASLRSGRAATWKQFWLDTLELIFSAKIRLRLYLSVMVIALVTTHSRMGNSAFFSSLLIAGVICLILSRHATRNMVILLVSLIAIDMFIVGSWFGVEKLAQRLENTTVQEYEARQDPSEFVYQQIADNPIFGTGPGTFSITFPRYRSGSVDYYFDYAHNDIAQFAVESGLLGCCILGVMVIWCLVVALIAQWRRRDPLMRGMSFASIMGVTALLIHSSVDFNLQIPANAMLFMVMLSLGWIALYLDKRPDKMA